MRNRFKCLLLSILMLPCLFLLYACNETEEPANLTALSSSMITLEYYTTTYNEEEKTPGVTVKLAGEEISSDNYSVEYFKNVNVGEAVVKVTAKTDSKIISGSAERNFTIARVNKVVSNYEQLSAALNNKNYVNLSLNGNIVIPEGKTLTVRKGVSLTFGVFTLENNGTLVNYGSILLSSKPAGEGTIQNNGTITANVNTREGLLNSFTYANRIVLNGNLTSDTAEMLPSIVIRATDQSYDFVLDLNGYDIETNIYIVGNQTNKLKVVLTNTTSESSTVGVNLESCQYGLIVLGDGNETIDVTLNKVNFLGYEGGIATNGNNSNGLITAKNCIFESKNLSAENPNAASVGAYLPAKYGYVFNECTFVGYTAYYAKSGNHVLNKCTLQGEGGTYFNPSHYGNGCQPTGSALVCDSAVNYKQPLAIYITGGTFKSQKGYGIEEVSTSAGGQTVSYGEISVSAGAKMEGLLGEYFTQNNAIDTSKNIIEEE